MERDIGRTGDTNRVSVELSDEPGGLATTTALAHYQQPPYSRDDYAAQPPVPWGNPVIVNVIKDDKVTLSYLDRAIAIYTSRFASNPCEFHLEQVLVKLKTARYCLKARIRCMQILNKQYRQVRSDID